MYCIILYYIILYYNVLYYIILYYIINIYIYTHAHFNIYIYSFNLCIYYIYICVHIMILYLHCFKNSESKQLTAYARTHSPILGFGPNPQAKRQVFWEGPRRKKCLMWLKQCHKPSPSHHHFLRWYKPSKMAIIVLPTLISFGILDDHPWNSWRST